MRWRDFQTNRVCVATFDWFGLHYQFGEKLFVPFLPRFSFGTCAMCVCVCVVDSVRVRVLVGVYVCVCEYLLMTAVHFDVVGSFSRNDHAILYTVGMV